MIAIDIHSFFYNFWINSHLYLNFIHVMQNVSKRRMKTIPRILGSTTSCRFHSTTYQSKSWFLKISIQVTFSGEKLNDTLLESIGLVEIVKIVITSLIFFRAMAYFSIEISHLNFGQELSLLVDFLEGTEVFCKFELYSCLNRSMVQSRKQR